MEAAITPTLNTPADPDQLSLLIDAADEAVRSGVPATITLMRYGASGREPVQGGVLGAGEFDPFSMGEKFGPGRYSATLKINGKYTRNATFSVSAPSLSTMPAGSSVGAGTTHPAPTAPAEPHGGMVGLLMTMMQQSQQAQREADARAQAIMLATMQQSTALLTSLAGGRESVKDLLPLIRNDPKTDLMAVLKLGAEMAQGREPAPAEPAGPDPLAALAPILAALLAPAAQPAAPAAAAPLTFPAAQPRPSLAPSTAQPPTTPAPATPPAPPGTQAEPPAAPAAPKPPSQREKSILREVDEVAPELMKLAGLPDDQRPDPAEVFAPLVDVLDAIAELFGDDAPAPWSWRGVDDGSIIEAVAAARPLIPVEAIQAVRAALVEIVKAEAAAEAAEEQGTSNE